MLHADQLNMMSLDLINVYNSISQSQNKLLIYFDSFKLLQDNIKLLSSKLLNIKPIDIDSEIHSLFDSITEFTVELSGNNPEIISVYSDYIDPGILAKDRFGNLLIVEVSNNNINTNVIGKYEIVYTIKNSNNTVYGSYTREVYISDFTAPIYNLLGENPIIWNINIPYVDPGIDTSDNYDLSLTIINTNNININEVGFYNYTYIITDDYDNFTIAVRNVYILDYSVVENIPIINISSDSSNNVTNIMKMVESTSYFKNNNLLLKDNFSIHFNNLDETYLFPLDKLKYMYANNNNIIVFVYGFNNETIRIVDNIIDDNYKFPYITDSIVPKKIANLILNNDNNYKLIVLDGKHSNLLDYRDPSLVLIGDNPYNLPLGSEFNDPGVLAFDYNNYDISNRVVSSTNLDINKEGDYSVLYIVNDFSGNQSIKSRKLNVLAELN